MYCYRYFDGFWHDFLSYSFDELKDIYEERGCVLFEGNEKEYYKYCMGLEMLK